MSPGVRFSASMEVKQLPMHYLVQYQSSCGGAVQNVTTSGTVHGLIQNVSGLTPNCVYSFRVAAVGASQMIWPFSKLANVYLPGECRRYPRKLDINSVLTAQVQHPCVRKPQVMYTVPCSA